MFLKRVAIGATFSLYGGGRVGKIAVYFNHVNALVWASPGENHNLLPADSRVRLGQPALKRPTASAVGSFSFKTSPRLN